MKRVTSIANEQPTTDRDVINGSRVETRVKAKLAYRTDGESYEQPDIDEVMLDNGDIWYQCAYRNGGCNQVFNNPRSVIGHIKIHAPRSQVRRLEQEKAELAAEADRLAVELAERKRRRSEGSKQGALNRAKKRDESSNGHAPVTAADLMTATDLTINATDIKRLINVLAFDLSRIGADLASVCDQLQNLAVTVDELTLVDPEVAAKAAKYDALKGLMS